MADTGQIIVEPATIVGWDSPSDPAAPRNWPTNRKWLTSAIGFLFCGCALPYCISAPLLHVLLYYSSLTVFSHLPQTHTCARTRLASISVSGYSISVSVIEAELGCSRILALAGISTYTIMFGIAPLILAPLSEIYGRRGVYIASTVVYTLFQLPQALAPNIATMLAARALSGVGGSTAISLLVRSILLHLGSLRVKLLMCLPHPPGRNTRRLIQR